jgi:hypothetical protein
MAVVETFGDTDQLYGFEVQDLGNEPSTKKWYTVVLGAGAFSVRAASENFALLKAEVRAQELRSSRAPLETNGGFPLVMAMTETDAGYLDAVWYEGKPEADLIGVLALGATAEFTDTPQRFFSAYDPNQGALFNPHKP